MRQDSKLITPPVTVVSELRTVAANLRREGKGYMTVDTLLETPAAVAVIERYRIVTQQFVERLISNDFATDPAQLTLDAFVAPDVTGFDTNFRIREGYSELLHRMADGLDIRLGTPVTGIVWDDWHARAFTKRGQFVAQQAIITVPVGVMQAGGLQFDPDLPRRTWHAFESIDPGAASKSILSFRSNYRGYPFWPANMNLMATDRRSQLWWETHPFQGPASAFMLTNLTAGAESRRMAAMHPDELEDRLLSQLQVIFSKKKEQVRRLFLDLVDTRHWSEDRWARGAYSAAPEDASMELTRRVGPLRFAGEAVGTRERGNVASVHGAISSGQYAAMKVLKSLS